MAGKGSRGLSFSPPLRAVRGPQTREKPGRLDLFTLQMNESKLQRIQRHGSWSLKESQTLHLWPWAAQEGQPNSSHAGPWVPGQHLKEVMLQRGPTTPVPKNKPEPLPGELRHCVTCKESPSDEPAFSSKNLGHLPRDVHFTGPLALVPSPLPRPSHRWGNRDLQRWGSKHAELVSSRTRKQTPTCLLPTPRQVTAVLEHLASPLKQSACLRLGFPEAEPESGPPGRVVG